MKNCTVGLRTKAVTAVHLARLALRWRRMRDLAESAEARLEKILPFTSEPTIQSKFYVVLWTLHRLPQAHASLILKALQNLDVIGNYFETQDQKGGGQETHETIRTKIHA